MVYDSKMVNEAKGFKTRVQLQLKIWFKLTSFSKTDILSFKSLLQRFDLTL